MKKISIEIADNGLIVRTKTEIKIIEIARFDFFEGSPEELAAFYELFCYLKDSLGSNALLNTNLNCTWKRE